MAAELQTCTLDVDQGYSLLRAPVDVEKSMDKDPEMQQNNLIDRFKIFHQIIAPDAC